MLTTDLLPARGRSCAVCGGPVLPGAPAMALAPTHTGARDLVSVCGDVACRWRVASAPASANCARCARPLEIPAARAAGECGTHACREMQRTAERARMRSARHEREHARLDAAARALRDTADAADDVPVALVPSTDADAFPMHAPPPYRPAVVPLPPRRRRGFSAHLRRIAAAAADEPPAPPPGPDSDTDAQEGGALFDAGCAMCGGRCCRQGGEHAYLTPRSARAWFDAHQGKSADAFVTAYARHLPRTTVADSCVYHTGTGCALPRALRSRTCNTFLCDGLTALRAAAAAGAAAGRPVRRAFLAVIEDGELARWGVADAGGPPDGAAA